MQSHDAGCVEEFGRSEAQARPPNRGIDKEDQPGAFHVREPRVRGQWRRQEGTQPLFQGVEPEGATQGIGITARQERIERFLRAWAGTPWWIGTGHRMTLHNPLHDLIAHLRTRIGHATQHAVQVASRQPLVAVTVLLAAGVAFGAGARTGVGFAQVGMLQAHAAQQQEQLLATQRQAQQEVNALAARVGELQAQANRLNALGERLAHVGKFDDGEFDFQAPVGVGGEGPVRDMPSAELRTSLDQLDSQFDASGAQLSVLESLLFNQKLDRDATPSRTPIAGSYITSRFGRRADPFGRGSQYHRGIDFHARTGDPVLAVASGVISYSGVRSGYGKVIEIDHGNGYVTRYAHNSGLLAQVGDLVRAGQQVARAGSTGRSTGAHVHFEVWDRGRVVNPRKFL